MKAKVLGHDSYTGKNFNYDIDNVVNVMKVLDRIIIVHEDEDGKPNTLQYLNGSVKIIIEN